MPFEIETRGLGAGSYPEPTTLDPTPPKCPICGRECETVHRDYTGEIVSCDMCDTTESAWEAPECFPEARYGEL